MEVASAAVQGLIAVFRPEAFALMMVGVVIGNIIGILPGLGGAFMLAIMIPFCFGMNPVSAFALLLGAHAVTATGGSITSILFNTPGEGANAATCFDGFQMTRKGQAGRALGAALWASAVGGVIGAVALLIAVPITRPLVLTFGPPEFLMLTVLGLCFIGTLAGGSSIKGLLSGLLGLALSLVGQDPNTGSIRYDFGIVYLWDGIKQIPALVGLFAVAEMIDLGIKGESLVSREMVEVKDSVWEGVKDVHRHWWLTLKSSLIAVYIGFLPGLGGSASAFFTYGYAQRTSKHPETFGKGNVEGVIAPEAANNAKEGGALIPTIAFGVPGSTGMAILLGAFVVLGITPGPKMLNEHLPVVFAMAWTLAIANIVGALETLIFAKSMARVTFIRGALLISPILVCAMLGSFSASNSMADLIVLLVFGVIGYFMKLYGYPKAPLVLAMILGRIAEVNFQISYTLFGARFLLRPFTLIISLLVLWTIIGPFFKKWWRKRKEVIEV